MVVTDVIYRCVLCLSPSTIIYNKNRVISERCLLRDGTFSFWFKKICKPVETLSDSEVVVLYL